MRTRRIRASALLVAMAAAILVPTGRADAAGTPLAVTNCSSNAAPGVTISTPGTYKLTRSVANCLGSPIIAITSSDVTLDLAGRVLDGNDNNSGCVNVSAPFLSNVTVKNGTVHDCLDGVNASLANPATVSGVTATSHHFDGIEVGPGGKAIGNLVADNGIIGIRGFESTITGNTATSNGKAPFAEGWGIYHQGNDDAPDVISGNTLSGNGISTGGGGINAFGSHQVVTKNIVAGSLVQGILVTAPNSTVTGNKVSGNHGHGVVVGEDTTVSKNVVTGSDGDGIRSTFTGNTFTANTSSGNGLSGIVTGDGSTVTKNTLNGNGGSGIYADDTKDNLLDSLVLSGNAAKGNVGDGIVLVDDADVGTSITSNTVIGNGLQGINIARGTPSPESVESNTAEANGTADQECDFSLCG